MKSTEYWPGGYMPWMEAYEPHLETCFGALALEGKMRRSSRIASGMASLFLSSDWNVPLAQRMGESGESKT